MTSFNSFTDAVNDAAGQKNILIGNGLSIAYSQSFSYTSLFDAADFEAKNPSISQVFEALKTKDFETVARALSSASEIARRFGQAAFADSLEAQIEDLKTALIKAVRSTHPEDRHCLTDGQCLSLQNWLLPFFNSDGSVFSLNYDSLLYWAILRRLDPRGPIQGQFADGFGDPENNNVRFLGDACAKPVNILFPHGCLFIFENEGHVIKPQAAIRETPLIEIIRENMEEGSFPLFVSEGSAEQKLKAIMKSSYLSYTFNRLSKQKDNFFIFGHSMDLESDGHILKAIAKNRDIKNIYASYFDSEDKIKSNLLKLRAEVSRSERDLKLHTYPSNSAKCW